MCAQADERLEDVVGLSDESFDNYTRTPDVEARESEQNERIVGGYQSMSQPREIALKVGSTTIIWPWTNQLVVGTRVCFVHTILSQAHSELTAARLWL